jgi:hypothetical protein
MYATYSTHTISRSFNKLWGAPPASNRHMVQQSQVFFPQTFFCVVVGADLMLDYNLLFSRVLEVGVESG